MTASQPSSRADRRARDRELERGARRWIRKVYRTDLSDEVKALAPVIAATAVRTGNAFTAADVVDQLATLQEVN